MQIYIPLQQITRPSLSFRAANQSLRLSTSIPSSMKGKRYMRLHRPLVAHRSHWWPSVIWSGTTIWFPGTVHLLSKMLSPALVVRMTICDFWSRGSSQRQRRRLLGPSLARNCLVFSGRSVCVVCHLPDRSLFQGGQHVRFPLVSQCERVYLLP